MDACNGNHYLGIWSHDGFGWIRTNNRQEMADLFLRKHQDWVVDHHTFPGSLRERIIENQKDWTREQHLQDSCEMFGHCPSCGLKLISNG